MTTESITPFLFEGEITVRIVMRENVPWFVATDVCRALGLTNAAETVSRLDDDERGISTTDTSAGQREVIVISESGLYVLIFKSRKPPVARKFRKWVTSEVLPSLRVTGMYVLPPAGIPTSNVPAIMKPYGEWSQEERRTAISAVREARHTHNTAAAVWLWEHLGLPMPPRQLLPSWWQADMFGDEPRDLRA